MNRKKEHLKTLPEISASNRESILKRGSDLPVKAGSQLRDSPGISPGSPFCGCKYRKTKIPVEIGIGAPCEDFFILK